MKNEKNIIREFNRSWFKEQALSKSAIKKFNTMPDIPDEKKQILYENITAPLFTKELEDELFSIMRILQYKGKDNNNDDEFELYIREFLIRFLMEMYSVNNRFYSEKSVNDINEYRKHMDEIYKNFPKKPDGFTGFFL